VKKVRLVSWILAAATTLLVAVLYLRGGFQGLENKSVDYRFKLRGDRVAHQDVVVITADEKSIAEMGRWPWSRDVHGRLVDWLRQAGAKAVAFDVLFTEPDKDRPWGDTRLGQAAQRNGRTVFGMLFQVGDGGLPTNPLFPIPPLRRESVRLGSVNIFPESDGVSRKVPVWMTYEGQIYPSLSLAAYAAYRGLPAEDAVAELNLPVEGNWNEFTVNFVGGFQSFPYFSFVDVVEGRVAPVLFKDKIVLVGGTATALFDFLAVPNVPVFPGLEVHANALDNYLNGNHLRRVGLGWVFLLILIFGLGAGVLTSRLPAWVGALSVTALVIGYFAACQTIFSGRNVVLDFVAPALAAVASYVVVLFYRFVTEEREKRWIKGTFSQYMSPKVIEAISANPSLLRLGGQEREMTVFFSDLAGFTSISEALKPSDLVAVLNEYLTDMSDIIMKHEGVVDKYIGDAIMAFWNAPLDQPNHASLACFAALDQIDKLKDLQKMFTDRGLPLIDCRIGVNTGNMVVGNMGSKKRFDYTVMGDSVNLASRLEGANKPFHTHIMISEFTYEKAKNDVETRQLDLLRVKGKAIPIKVYELLARKGGLTEDQKKAVGLYEDGLNYYREKKFQKAVDSFKKVLEFLPGDGPAETYIERCRAFLAAPPPKEWDGVFVMTTK
jgi:adenylate cyclase